MTAPIAFVPFARDVLGVNLYPHQRVACLVAFDGVQPADLEPEDQERALTLFGPVSTVPPLARETVVAIMGGRSGKSYVLGALRLLHLGLTHPLSTLAPGELGFGLIVAPDMKLARQTLRFVAGAARLIPQIATRIEKDTPDELTIARPDGRTISFVTLPATRGGSAVRSRSYFAAFLDETQFFYADDGYTVTLGGIIAAVAPRVLDGGQLILASTTYLESGEDYTIFRENHANPSCAIDGEVTPGTPTNALAMWAPTKLFNLSPKIHRAVDREYERDAENAEREFGARWVLRGGSRYFDPIAIRQCTQERPTELRPSPGDRVFAAFDPGFTVNSSAGAIIYRNGDKLTTAQLFELRPEKGKPLVPSAAIGAFVEVAKAHGATELWTDIHYLETVREHSGGLHVEQAPDKEAMHALTRTVLLESRHCISTGHAALVQQLRAIVGKPRQGGGTTITSPRIRGRHGDVASAWVLATWAAASHPCPTAPLCVSPKGFFPLIGHGFGNSRSFG